jgi:5,10-methylene-tetrahydrofolate dehydrogenase/methenyl tetrahydrofolate cyclohydrolase
VPTKLLAGQPVAEAVLKDVAERIKALKKNGITPGFGTILVGDDSASAGYLHKKHETCEQAGEVAGWITPRLVGVGPTTVAMLLRNTFEAAERTPKKLE